MPRGKSSSAPKIVFVAATTHVRAKGSKYPTLLTAGEAWYADDPLVQSHPWAFIDTPSVVRGAPGAPVEQATAAPGEVRNTERAEG